MGDTHKIIHVPVDWDWHVDDWDEDEILNNAIDLAEREIDERKDSE